ncbi:sigma-70 family RNA polymerase sigma factor [Streptomyces sp. NPDC005574]|uniref:sigma-70 family RNA polymerase sigma factor n=1 Tax=Streptomyces sp. NPDC005574 TaxID=3156891 RepID=UPI0033AD95D1
MAINGAAIDSRDADDNQLLFGGCTDFDAGTELMEMLYREHAPALRARVLRLVAGDQQRAEDVVQETMLRAWKHKTRLRRGDGSLRPWLVTVAKRIAIDGYRSRQEWRDAGPEILEDLPAAEEIDRTLTLMVLYDALAALSPPHREVLVETYFKGVTHIDAANRLGIPSGTVRSRVFYALRSMKLLLEERGVFNVT